MTQTKVKLIIKILFGGFLISLGVYFVNRVSQLGTGDGFSSPSDVQRYLDYDNSLSQAGFVVIFIGVAGLFSVFLDYYKSKKVYKK